ncbi:MAG TPA: ABC transporter ATP-binding protein [Candidatus Bathyarchaeia archaeon]|nr:ABC transporter ATP-binding protein [Candidatus Bathyarchaeia archaeon]
MKRDFSIETKGLRRLFKSRREKKDVVALDGIDLEVPSGEIFGLLGPNGAGKTTLIKILCTLLYPTDGSAYVKGLDVVKQAPQIRRLINLVSGGETPGYGILTVKENLWFFSQIYGLARDQAKDRVAKLVDQLELGEYTDTRMSKLSTGYKQRLNLARGFVNDPAVLFLDEPTLGLDVLSARHLRELVKSWIPTGDKTVLLTTHYMAEADQMCDHVGIINQGRILALDTPANLKAKLRSEVSWKLEISPGLSQPDILKAIPGVRGISQSDNIETGTSSMKLLLDDESVMSDVLSKISASGSKVLSMGKLEPTLEDVYISLVGKGME